MMADGGTSAAAILPGIALALAMGLRHGLAPDHLAAIDGLTMRAVVERPRQAPWMGAWFAAGHACGVMLIVVAAAYTSAWVAPYRAVVHWLELAPPVLLLVLAGLNARQLLRTPATGGHRCHGAGPMSRLRVRASPWAAMGLGAVFALGFESALQAAAWGFAAAALESIGPALLVAAVFTGGMAVTDGIDGWIAARIARTGTPHHVAQFRRRLGWPIVALCVLSALAMLAERACTSCAIGEDHGFAIGAAVLAATALAYGCALRAARK